jgi:5,10-methylenetetrahydromethanopterin reductase
VGERHLHTFEGHVTHLADRDLPLLEHMDVEGRTSNALGVTVGEPAAIRQVLAQLAAAGHHEVMYNPAGPDVAQELEAFARVRR